MIKIVDLFIAHDLQPTADNIKHPIALYVESESDNGRNITEGTVVGVKNTNAFSTISETEVEKYMLFQVDAIKQGLCIDESDIFFQRVYPVDRAFLPMNYDTTSENEMEEMIES